MQQVFGCSVRIEKKELLPGNEREETVYHMLERMKEYSPETFEHSYAVSKLAGRLGAVLGYCPEDIIRLNIAGMLHDIGKTVIPEEILHKKGTLTEKEWSVMKQHPDRGYKMLLPYIRDVDILLAVRQHHERLDGSGYPDGIGSGITEFARIIMIADVFDGMTRKRAYRAEGISEEKAKRIMCSEEYLYDKRCLQAFLNVVSKNCEEGE